MLSYRLPWDLAAVKWAADLNPIIILPLINGTAITNITLKANTPTPVNHLLQRLPQGWLISDKTTNANIWRTATYSTLTITLESSADTTISLWVY